MKGTILTRKIFNREIFVYLPNRYNETRKRYPVIYIQDGDKFKKVLIEIINSIESKFSCKSLDEHILVGITPIDRLNEYTPWFSKALNEKFHDFRGEADDYLSFLSNDLQNYIETEFKASTNKEDRKIMGYSLGALVSLYSLYRNNNYGEIASICASQWYENWIEFIDKNHMINDNFKLILISGKKEGQNKVTIHKYAPKFSEQSYQIFMKKSNKSDIDLVWDEYDHHENVVNRYKTALEFLLKKK